MPVAGDIITMALKTAGVLGVGQTALPDDTNDALTQLNWMLSQWRRKRWLVYHLVDLALTANGNTSYTIGPGGDFNIPFRPDRLESAFVRQLVTSIQLRADYGLEIIDARETYNNIVLKQYNSFPQTVFYDPGYPLGTLWFTPTPGSGQFEIHLAVKDALQQFATANDVISLPEEYYAALYFNLARRLRVSYQLPPDPELNALCTDALNVIRGADLQLARLQMPPGLPGVGKGSFGQGLFGGGTSPAGVAITENWAGGALVTSGTYTLLGSAPYQFTVTGAEIYGGDAGGSFNASILINGQLVGGLSSVPITGNAAAQLYPSAGPFTNVSTGAVITLVIDTVVGAPTNAYVTLLGLRTS